MRKKEYAIHTYAITAPNDERGRAHIADWKDKLEKSGCKYVEISNEKVAGVKWQTALEIR